MSFLLTTFQFAEIGLDAGSQEGENVFRQGDAFPLGTAAEHLQAGVVIRAGQFHGQAPAEFQGISCGLIHNSITCCRIYVRLIITFIMLSAIISTVLLSAALNVIPAPQETRLNGKETPVTAMDRCRVRFTKKLKPEEYILKVRRKSVRIKAGGPAGEFYARQTLAQERDNQGVLLRGTIKDSPRFGWRGYMLDESRHFFGEEFVMKTLDLMAYYKLNKFHWHLTDAPGWRIEIKKYPLLTRYPAVIRSVR